jgi:ribosome maturation factor RimP
VGIDVHSFVFILKYLSGSGGIGICECDSVSNYKKEVDMGKREDYEAKTEQLIAPIIAANHVELFDVDYIKEGQDWYLRVYIDKEGGVTIDDCQAVSRAFNEVLDKENYIADQYIFEVSSPGLTRPLKKEKDYEKSIGRLLDIKLYKPVEGKKEYAGILKEYNKDIIIIESDDTQITIERSNLAMIRWAYVD